DDVCTVGVLLEDLLVDHRLAEAAEDHDCHDREDRDRDEDLHEREASGRRAPSAHRCGSPGSVVPGSAPSSPVVARPGSATMYCTTERQSSSPGSHGPDPVTGWSPRRQRTVTVARRTCCSIMGRRNG